MPMVACSKGCGHDVDVPQDALARALATGRLVFQHSTCPGENSLRDYTVEVSFYRNFTDNGGEQHSIKLAAIGSSISDVSFVDAFPKLAEKLQDHLIRAAQMVPTAEEGVEQEIEAINATAELTKEGTASGA